MSVRSQASRSTGGEPGGAAVWRLEADAIRPIEAALARYLGLQPT